MPRTGPWVSVCLVLMALPLLIPWNVVGAMWNIFALPEIGLLGKTINSLGIGPMGFGGKTTALGVKIGVVDRIPASYYVSVAYMCWAYRRRKMTFVNGEATYE